MRGLRGFGQALQSACTKLTHAKALMPDEGVQDQCQQEMPASGKKVEMFTAQGFAVDALTRLDVPKKSAIDMAESLIAADYMGHRSLGIRKLPSIAADLLCSKVSARAIPEVVLEMEGLALVDGRNAPGPVVANCCMDLALQMARTMGFGYAAARNANCIGLASWYAWVANNNNMIGVCMSSAGPTLMFPEGFAAQEQFLAGFLMSACSMAHLVYLAFDPKQFSDSLEDQESDFRRLLLAAAPCEKGLMPLVPGDKEISHMESVDDQGGCLFMTSGTLAELKELAHKLDMEPLQATDENHFE